MAEQALYRKYRSADFSQVIGQDHIVGTLVAAIAADRLSHAYLFTGPRGVGKTSVARLLARALNCTSTSDRPCNTCPNCLAIINSSLDIVEIDAASNRSIDSIRELRDKVALAPAIGKHKVYIIDEVHMLTSEAFNALLKTLEEPPAHAVFILATTEAHKVPETIISRTQRFSFKPIGTADITRHLSQIAKAEHIAIEDPALELLAVGARGGFRDAISAFDQVAASGQQPITAGTVRDLLGYTDAEQVGAISRGIAAGNTRAALTAAGELLAAGSQPGQLITQLVDQWRAIMLASAGVGDAAGTLTGELAATVSPNQAARVIAGLLEAMRSASPREAFEAAVVMLTVPVAPPVSVIAAAPLAVTPPPAIATVSTPPVAPPPPAAPAPTSDADIARWPKVVMIIKQKHNSLAALLAMYPVEVTADGITIKSRFNFHRDLFMKSQNRSAIEAVVEKVYGRPIPVIATTEDGGGAGANRVPQKPMLDPSTELISSALEILGGEVVD